MYDQNTGQRRPIHIKRIKGGHHKRGNVSTNSVMPHPQAGEVDLICKQDGIICGLQVFERVFTLLDADTKVEFYVKDGDRVENKQLIGKVYGDIRVLLCG